jgi:hypothetical protein
MHADFQQCDQENERVRIVVPTFEVRWKFDTIFEENFKEKRLQQNE